MMSLSASPGLATTIILIHLFVFGATPVAAQSDRPITISAGTHALTVPWYPEPMTNRFNPTVMVGTDRTLRSSEHWRAFFAINFGVFRHHWWMTGVSLEPEVGIGRRIAGGFQAGLRIGLGYMHYFWRRSTLELKNGRYVEATDRGSPSVILPVSVTFGYPGAASDPLSISPFVTARWGVQGLFLDEVPALTHLQFLVGVRIDRKEKPTDGRR